MISEITWRTFLNDLVRQMDADEKQEFCQAVDVSMATVNRWRRGKDWPKTENLKRLLAFLSDKQRQQFLVLTKKDPKMWARLPVEVRASVPEEIPENTSLSPFQLEQLDYFCLKLLRLQRDSPDRFWQVSKAALREGLKHLETHPVVSGLEMIIAKCMPPRDGKIRSLRLLVSMGTPPWRGDLHGDVEGFLGIESLAGRAVARRRGEMIPDLTTNKFHAFAQVMGPEKSAAAFPIMRATGLPNALREDGVAGALFVLSAQTDYFTPERMELIEIFADVIRLAFFDPEFYPAHQIDLGLMPPWSVQSAHFERFRRRVDDEYRRASLQEDSSQQELEEIEERVRAQMEKELLEIARSGNSLVI